MNFDRRNMLRDTSFALLAAGTARFVRADDGETEFLRCRPLPQVKPADTGPGKKFSADGSAQRFPGNTVICHIPRPSATFDALAHAYAELRASVATEHLAWLPPESYHMTVFDGVTDAFRRPGDWPQMLPLDASMEACGKYVGERLRTLDLGFSPPICMTIDDADSPLRTLLALRPIDAAENRRLRDLRDRIAQAIGVRHANHDSYRFHTSFAYYIRPFPPEAEADYLLAYARMVRRLRKTLPVIELGAPEYCVFDDMTQFREQFRLRRR